MPSSCHATVSRNATRLARIVSKPFKKDDLVKGAAAGVGTSVGGRSATGSGNAWFVGVTIGKTGEELQGTTAGVATILAVAAEATPMPISTRQAEVNHNANTIPNQTGQLDLQC